MITLLDAQRVIHHHEKLKQLRASRRFVAEAGYVRVVISDRHDRNGQTALYRQAGEHQTARKVRAIILADLDIEIAEIERELNQLGAEVPA